MAGRRGKGFPSCIFFLEKAALHFPAFAITQHMSTHWMPLNWVMAKAAPIMLASEWANAKVFCPLTYLLPENNIMAAAQFARFLFVLWEALR